MKIDVSKAGDSNNITLIKITGRLDTSSSMQLEEQLDDIIGKGDLKIAMDMAGVDYLNSFGVRVLISVGKKLNSKQGQLKLLNLPENVKKLFKVTAITDLFDIYDDSDSAVKSFE
jgi:anti-anti-sigma factor